MRACRGICNTAALVPVHEKQVDVGVVVPTIYTVARPVLAGLTLESDPLHRVAVVRAECVGALETEVDTIHGLYWMQFLRILQAGQC
jgi:hypothetical protein